MKGCIQPNYICNVNSSSFKHQVASPIQRRHIMNANTKLGTHGIRRCPNKTIMLWSLSSDSNAIMTCWEIGITNSVDIWHLWDRLPEIMLCSSTAPTILAREVCVTSTWPHKYRWEHQTQHRCQTIYNTAGQYYNMERIPQTQDDDDLLRHWQLASTIEVLTSNR